jgi:hypothetical protein
MAEDLQDPIDDDQIVILARDDDSLPLYQPKPPRRTRWLRSAGRSPILYLDYGQDSLIGSRPRGTCRMARLADGSQKLPFNTVLSLFLTLSKRMLSSMVSLDKRSSRSTLGISGHNSIMCADCERELFAVRCLLENPEFVIDFVGRCECESQSCPFERALIPGRKARWSLDCSHSRFN